MTRKLLISLAALGSAGLLLGAFGFQYLADLPPCKMCIWQRWPHGSAALLGAAALALGTRVLAYLGGLTVLIGAGIAFFHAGVEKKWWDGPSTCTSSGTEGLSAEELMAQILNAPIVRCDEVPWDMLGISMAGWNGILSLVLVGFWIAAARRA
jgi:disulfide bond formation protein DsbB